MFYYVYVMYVLFAADETNKQSEVSYAVQLPTLRGYLTNFGSTLKSMQYAGLSLVVLWTFILYSLLHIIW